MDIDQLTPQQIELSFQLCDILSLEDLSVAATVLQGCHWSIEKAVNELQLGNLQQTHLQTPPLKKETFPLEQSEYSYNQGDQEEDLYEENLFEYENLTEQKKKMFEEEYASLVPLQKTHSEPNKQLAILEQHRRLAGEDRKHHKEYMKDIMKKSEAVCQSLLQSQPEKMQKYRENNRKIDNNRSFLNFLYTSYAPRINFTFGTFFLNLTRSYLENKYLLVYIHTAQPEIQAKFENIVQLIMRQKEIAHFVNQNCIAYGMFDNSDDYELLQKHVPLKDLPSFALFRLSKGQKTEQFVSQYQKISSQGEIFLEWAAQSMGIPLKKKEGSHIEEYKMAKAAIKKQEGLEKQKEEEAQKKMAEQQEYIAHRDIREQQDELWAELEKMHLEKKQLSLDRRENMKNREEEYLERKREAEKEGEPEKGEGVIEIRFRMPVSGEAKARCFRVGEKVEKMFRYVDCFCRQEFEEKFNDFDLKQSFPPISLASKRHLLIGEVFQGSSRENVIVREL